MNWSQRPPSPQLDVRLQLACFTARPLFNMSLPPKSSANNNNSPPLTLSAIFTLICPLPPQIQHRHIGMQSLCYPVKVSLFQSFLFSSSSISVAPARFPPVLLTLLSRSMAPDFSYSPRPAPLSVVCSVLLTPCTADCGAVFALSDSA